MADWSTLELEWPSDMDVTVQIVLLGFVTLRLALNVWGGATPGSWLDAVATWTLFATGFALVAAGATEFDVARWGRHLAAAVLLAYTVGSISIASSVPALSTDAMMFTREAADVLLQGGNPYTASMQDSFALPGAAYEVSTARIDGSMVDSWSYPSGAIVAATPAAFAGVQVRYVVLAATVLAGGLLIAVSPPEWALLGLGSLIIARDFFLGAVGGLIDPLWMLPVLVAMVLWARDRWLWAAFVLGLAVGTKQHAWFLLPFLAVWVWHDANGPRDFIPRAVRLNAAGAAGALVLNAPFIAMDPEAWLHGILTPIRGASMLPLGVGVTLISRLGLYSVATWWHTLAAGLVAGWLLLWYHYRWQRVKWLGWALPAAVLFVHYRSLPTYILTWLPVLWLGVLANTGRLDTTHFPFVEDGRTEGTHEAA